MAEKFKSKDEINSLALMLKERRLTLGLTLKNIEKSQHINCGQISRLESGKFKTNSRNLQKLCIFLQIPLRSSSSEEDTLGARLEHFAERSPQHRAAAEDLLSALERLS